MAVSGKSSFSKKLNMKKFKVGYHTIKATLLHHNEKAVKYKVPTYIYKKPVNKFSYYSSGQNYITVTNNTSGLTYDSDCGIYFDLKQKGKKWKKGYGPIKPYASKKKNKLKSNKEYSVRIYYSKKFKYRGKTYTFKGKVSKAKKIKTGKKLPKIKSIKITNAKVYISNIAIIIGGYGYRPIYTEFKVTVRLKKKPGTKGIYIGQQRIPGNKKKYTATFSQSGNLIGEKLDVAVYSYQSTKYGGYSNVVRKKAKVRK